LENEYFLNLVDQFLKILITYSESIRPDSFNDPKTIERYKKQVYYCFQQKRNDKTRNVLAKIFGSDWANKYIDKVLFDSPLLT